MKGKNYKARKVTVHVDFFYVNEISFLHRASGKFNFITADACKSRSKKLIIHQTLQTLMSLNPTFAESHATHKCSYHRTPRTCECRRTLNPNHQEKSQMYDTRAHETHESLTCGEHP